MLRTKSLAWSNTVRGNYSYRSAKLWSPGTHFHYWPLEENWLQKRCQLSISVISCPWVSESELRNDSDTHPELRPFLAELFYSKELPTDYTEWALLWARNVITQISLEGWTRRPEVKLQGSWWNIQCTASMQKVRKRRKGKTNKKKTEWEEHKFFKRFQTHVIFTMKC